MFLELKKNFSFKMLTFLYQVFIFTLLLLLTFKIIIHKDLSILENYYFLTDFNKTS